MLSGFAAALPTTLGFSLGWDVTCYHYFLPACLHIENFSILSTGSERVSTAINKDGPLKCHPSRQTCPTEPFPFMVCLHLTLQVAITSSEHHFLSIIESFKEGKSLIHTFILLRSWLQSNQASLHCLKMKCCAQHCAIFLQFIYSIY